MKKELIKSRKEKEIQLAKLSAHVDKSFICSELYNKVVIEKAILKKQLDGVKVLGNGKLEKKITIQASKFSASALEKIKEAGSKAEVI